MVLLTVEVLLGVCLACIIALMIRLEACHRALIVMADNVKEAFKRDIQEINASFDDSIIDNIREEILDVVQNMRPPTIADHLGGIMGQFAQMKLMKMMKEEGMMAITQGDEEVV